MCPRLAENPGSKIALERMKAQAVDLGVSPALADLTLTESFTHIVYRHVQTWSSPACCPLLMSPETMLSILTDCLVPQFNSLLLPAFVSDHGCVQSAWLDGCKTTSKGEW